MQMVGSPAWMWLAEPVHLLRAIGRVQIFELSQRLETGSCSREFLYADKDVDDRLGVEARDGSAADMVNTADDPGSNCITEENPLALEVGGPLGVIGDNANRLVTSGSH